MAPPDPDAEFPHRTVFVNHVSVRGQRWLLSKIPESEFDIERGMSPKRYWEKMADRLERTWLF